jgi:hypothetical protein
MVIRDSLSSGRRLERRLIWSGVRFGAILSCSSLHGAQAPIIYVPEDPPLPKLIQLPSRAG